MDIKWYVKLGFFLISGVVVFHIVINLVTEDKNHDLMFHTRKAAIRNKKPPDEMLHHPDDVDKKIVSLERQKDIVKLFQQTQGRSKQHFQLKLVAITFLGRVKPT